MCLTCGRNNKKASMAGSPNWADTYIQTLTVLGSTEWQQSRVPVGKGSQVVCAPHGWDFKLQLWGLWFIISGHKLISLVCMQKCSSGFTFAMLFVSPCKSQNFLGPGLGERGPGQTLRGLRNYRACSLSYLKCCLICCACRQSQNPGSVQAGQRQVRGQLSCFWILNKIFSILI